MLQEAVMLIFESVDPTENCSEITTIQLMYSDIE